MITLNDLALKPTWVTWAEELTKQGKLTKIPKDPATGYNARIPTDPSTYGTLADAIKLFETMDGNGGIGVVLDSIGGGFSQVGIDLDSCRDPKSGQINDWAAEIINRFDTYAEVSPSETGVKLFFQMDVAGLSGLRTLLGRDLRGKQRTRKSFAVGEHREVAIDTARFYAVTGERLDGCSDDLRIVPISDVKWFIQEAAPNYLARHKTSNGQYNNANGDPGPTDDMSGSGFGFRFLQSCRRQGKSKEEAIRALLIDSTQAGEWARRSDERQHDRAWENGDLHSAVGEPETTAPDGGVTLKDFRAYMPTHSYIFMPTREMWAGASVNSRLPTIPLFNEDGTPRLKNGKQENMTPTGYLDKEKPVEQMTWAPGLPMLITDRFISEGGWIERQGVTVFNLYRPPSIVLGDRRKATPWIRLVIKVFGKKDARHIISWFACRRQHPERKINHALVFGSETQGIGKDTILEPVIRAIGAWNCSEVSPKSVTGRFNPFLKSVLLRVSEVRDLGDVSRYDFYEAMKAYTASPPDVLTCDEKNLREHRILNCVGIIYTTNHKQGGMFLPAEDRRHFVAWSARKKADFKAGYWDEMWAWLNNGGDSHVAAYLTTYDISKFNPKAPPPQTPAFWEIVDSNRAPEQSELADVLDQMGNPQATTINLIAANCGFEPDFAAWLRERKNRRAFPHRMEKCGYVVVRNDTADDGLWKIHGKRQNVYALITLTIAQRYMAVTALKDGKQQQKPERRRVFN